MVDFFIHRPVFSTVCALLIILAGAVCIPTLPIAQFPISRRRKSVSPPFIPEPAPKPSSPRSPRRLNSKSTALRA